MAFKDLILNIKNFPKQVIKKNDTQHFFNYEKISLSDFYECKVRGIHHLTLQPNSRSSYPHAESHEEECVYVLRGKVFAWINGFIYPLEAGHFVGFVAGTGISHTFINMDSEPCELLVIGEKTKKENLCSFPLNPEFNSDKIFWTKSPNHLLGSHLGIPKDKTTSLRNPNENPMIANCNSLNHYDGFFYSVDPNQETFGKGLRLSNIVGLKKIAFNHEILEPGKRSSWPHAHLKEEEFVYVLGGQLTVWLNGFEYLLQKNDCIYFPPGTNISHCLQNKSDAIASYICIGDCEDDMTDRIHYPLHEARNQQCKEMGFLWEDRPPTDFYL